jgi:hypothetical protein
MTCCRISLILAHVPRKGTEVLEENNYLPIEHTLPLGHNFVYHGGTKRMHKLVKHQYKKRSGLRLRPAQEKGDT